MFRLFLGFGVDNGGDFGGDCQIDKIWFVGGISVLVLLIRR